jgi:ribosomal protein S26
MEELIYGDKPNCNENDNVSIDGTSSNNLNLKKMKNFKDGGNQVCTVCDNVSVNGTSFNEYNYLMESLISEDEREALNAIAILFERYTVIKLFSENTYIINCIKFSDCVKIALEYLKRNNKQFETVDQYIDVIATTEDNNVFVVLTK